MKKSAKGKVNPSALPPFKLKFRFAWIFLTLPCWGTWHPANTADTSMFSESSKKGFKNSFASSLASKIVYREGIHFIESKPVDRLAERAIVYHREERRVRALLDDLQKSSLPQAQKDVTMELIRRGGVRAALGVY